MARFLPAGPPGKQGSMANQGKRLAIEPCLLGCACTGRQKLNIGSLQKSETYLIGMMFFKAIPHLTITLINHSKIDIMIYRKPAINLLPFLLIGAYLFCLLLTACGNEAASASTSEEVAPAQMQSTIEEENKALVKQWLESRNTHNLEAALALWSDDWSERITRGFDGTTESFPDVKITVDDMIAEDNKVVLQWTFTGTHQGAFQDIAATGKAVNWKGIDIYTITDGKITGHARAADGSALRRQLTDE